MKAKASEAGDEDVEMGDGEMEDVVPNVEEGGGWTMNLARR
jgi:hypothetical protein